MVYSFSRIIFKIFLKILFKLEITGKENLPNKGPFIAASNHVSYIDPVVVGVACNTAPIVFMAKKDLFNIPILGSWFKAVGCISINQNSPNFGSLKEGVQKLKQGRALGIFPEGTRAMDGLLREPEPGIGLIALRSGAPIVPICVSGTDRVLPKGQRFIKFHRIKAKIGKVVDITECTKLSERRKIYKSVSKKVMDAILQLKNNESRK